MECLIAIALLLFCASARPLAAAASPSGGRDESWASAPAARELIGQARAHAFTRGMPGAAAPRGTVVFLWGKMDRAWVEKEKARFEPLARALERNGFSVAYNPAAAGEDLRRAVEDPRTAILIWSGDSTRLLGLIHKGVIVDAGGRVVPGDVFAKPGGSLRQVILAVCDGESARRKYAHETIPDFFQFGEGRVYTEDLFDFLEDPGRWPGKIEDDFGVRLDGWPGKGDDVKEVHR